MAPTGQRLGTHDLAGAYIAFRLEEQLDAILAQRRFYAGDDLAFEDERLAHAGVVQSHAVEVAALHRAKRDDRAVAHDADRRSRILDADTPRARWRRCRSDIRRRCRRGCARRARGGCRSRTRRTYRPQRRASGCAPSGEKRRARARPRYLRSSSPQSSPCRSLNSLKWSTSKQTMLTSRAPECLRYAAASSKKASLPSSPVAASMRGASMETRAKPVEPASPSRPAVDLSVTRVPF